MKRTNALALLVLACSAACGKGSLFDPQTVEFAGHVDAGRLSMLAVQDRGRIAILDTLARRALAQLYGARTIDGLPPALAYMELYFNSGVYAERPVIYVREGKMRTLLSAHLAGQALADFNRTGRLPPSALLDAEAWELLLRAGRAEKADLPRADSAESSAKSPAKKLRQALTELGWQMELRVPLDRLSARYESFLAAGAIRVVPSADPSAAWLALEDGQADMGEPQRRMLGEFQSIRDAWRRRDWRAVNDALAQFAPSQRRLSGRSRPAAESLGQLELLYNRTYSATVVFVGFAAAAAAMIVAVASSRRWARQAGMTLLSLSTAALAGGFIVRWVLSGRAWYLPPIMNQFEAVTGSALLGAAAAIVLERIFRRNYFALAAALYAAAALLIGLLFPEALAAGISATHGILNSPVMAVHVTVILIGHAMAGMTLVTSSAYLAVAAVRVIGGRNLQSAGAGLAGDSPAAALVSIDRCNLIFAQLAAWMIVLGTILGAYWGDFAWGRWWGFDPKETWALITALVFIAVLHVRMVAPPRYRGLLTAGGCLVGCAVMLFNWTVVNYLIAGKHSYA